MKSNYIVKSILAIAVVSVASCKPELSEVTPSKGNADFSRYVALGNSLTSGFADGGLYLEGQKNSFPEIIAGQMKAVGGGSFTSPLFSEAQFNGSGYLRFAGFKADGTPNIERVTTQTAVRGQVNIPPVGNVILYTKYTGDINNYGVPGIKLDNADLAPYGNFNGYFERLLPGNAGTNNTSYIDFVMQKDFTFFSMWLGGNDILGYASSGGAGDVPTLKTTFSTKYASVLARLTSKGAKGVVATIPDITITPYFRTVTLASLLAAVRATPAGANVNTLYLRTGAGVARAATAEDLFTLTLSSDGVFGVNDPLKGPYGLSPANPIENKYALDKDEVAVVIDFTNSYNATIKAAANTSNLAIVDAGALLKEYGAGTKVNGVGVSAEFIRGNLFSLDGIHLTPLGYAIVANEFIKAINSKYSSSIPTVDASKYRGTLYP
ncbi:SGNH/GDSL hydrolase family protein [Pedobacter metabolipauper]|uniref:GDSL-like lipase/acylhydrolase family protein n=1 Tax=Pedobacter metabolipauper TaxID=425513 RepID=A0A4R6SUD7_9SPHI|nr:SGNH/GDSL hydrolase family protein [Pedobacter metabolipauper]TDQ07694.1 GDSL-like lipase/acylhydrolase family protein [Pedobacter metabolipauper]